MKDLFVLVAHLLTTLVKLMKPGGMRSVMAESLLLKHQLLVLNRGRKRVPTLSPWDRLLLALASLWVAPSRIRKLAVILKPSTLLTFHKLLVSKRYQRLFTSTRKARPGPKGPNDEIVAAILEIKHRNPRFGCPRIALEITHAFGIEIDKDVVRRVLAKHCPPRKGNGGPSWLTFIGHTKDSLWSVDFFRCESILNRPTIAALNNFGWQLHCNGLFRH
jgi:putative transposase